MYQYDNRSMMFRFGEGTNPVEVTKVSHARMMVRGPDGSTPAEECDILSNDGLYEREEAAGKLRATNREVGRQSQIAVSPQMRNDYANGLRRENVERDFPNR